MCQAGNCFIIGRDKDHKFAYCIPCYPQYAMQCTSWYYWLLLLEETDDKNALSVHNNKKIYDEVSSGWPQWLCFLFCMCLGSNKHWEQHHHMSFKVGGKMEVLCRYLPGVKASPSFFSKAWQRFVSLPISLAEKWRKNEAQGCTENRQLTSAYVKRKMHFHKAATPKTVQKILSL